MIHKGNSQDITTGQEKVLESLTVTNEYARMDAAMKLDNERRAVINKLIAILNGTNADIVKVDAVIVLGQYRAQESIPILLRHLEWDELTSKSSISGTVFGNPPLEVGAKDYGTVTMALKQIGMPAVPALLDKITQTDDTKITTKCVSICKAIEGPDVTGFRLKALLDKETDPKIKARIQSALDALKKLDPAK